MKLSNAIYFVVALLAISFAYPAQAMEHGKMDHADMGDIKTMFHSTQKMGFHRCPHKKNMMVGVGMNCMCDGMRSCNPAQDKPGAASGSQGVDSEAPLSLAIAVSGDPSIASISFQMPLSNIFGPEPHPPRLL